MHEHRKVSRHISENLIKETPGMNRMDSNRNLILFCKPEVEGKKPFLILYIRVFACFIQPCFSYAEPDSIGLFLLDELPQAHKFNF